MGRAFVLFCLVSCAAESPRSTSQALRSDLRLSFAALAVPGLYSLDLCLGAMRLHGSSGQIVQVSFGEDGSLIRIGGEDDRDAGILHDIPTDRYSLVEVELRPGCDSGRSLVVQNGSQVVSGKPLTLPFRGDFGSAESERLHLDLHPFAAEMVEVGGSDAEALERIVSSVFGYL